MRPPVNCVKNKRMFGIWTFALSAKQMTFGMVLAPSSFSRKNGIVLTMLKLDN